MWLHVFLEYRSRCCCCCCCCSTSIFIWYRISRLGLHSWLRFPPHPHLHSRRRKHDYVAIKNNTWHHGLARKLIFFYLLNSCTRWFLHKIYNSGLEDHVKYGRVNSLLNELKTNLHNLVSPRIVILPYSDTLHCQLLNWARAYSIQRFLVVSPLLYNSGPIQLSLIIWGSSI